MQIPLYSATLPVEITPTAVQLAPVNEKFQPDLNRSTWREVPADFVLLLIGYEMDSSLLESAGVALQGPGRAPVLNPATMETNVPGFYVAGTAAGGTQLRFKLFIENCHVHVLRILRSLTGQEPLHINPLAFSQLLEDPLVAES